MKISNRIRRGNKKDTSSTTSQTPEGFPEGRIVHLADPHIVNQRIFNIAAQQSTVRQRRIMDLGTDLLSSERVMETIQNLLAGIEREIGALPNTFGIRALISDYLSVYFGGTWRIETAPASLVWVRARGENGRVLLG